MGDGASVQVKVITSRSKQAGRHSSKARDRGQPL
jgi:hypothetical protein